MTQLPDWEDIVDPRVLAAMARVPRDQLVPEAQRPYAREDRPLPIGLGQTISQPYVVALMTQLLRLQPGSRVLEIGTGSGYQAAILSMIAQEVFTIEVLEFLTERARRDLTRLGYARNIHFKTGDGYSGWPDAAPFDGIVVTAAPPRIPPPLLEQLAPGGRLVIPVGQERQELQLVERRGDSFGVELVIPVRFVPMTGNAQEEPPAGIRLPPRWK